MGEQKQKHSHKEGNRREKCQRQQKQPIHTRPGEMERAIEGNVCVIFLYS